MEKSSKRGKIPQSDWPSIMARYDAGETLSSIARTYDCSPPAISYVVSRSRARQPVDAVSPPAARAAGEPQLIKSPSAEMSATNGRGSAFAPPAVPASLMAKEPLSVNEAPAQPTAPAGVLANRAGDIWPSGTNGFDRNDNSVHAPPRDSTPTHQSAVPAHPGQPNGDHRRTLHLSLGNGSHESGPAQGSGPQPEQRHDQPHPLHRDDADRSGPSAAAPIQQPGPRVADYGRPAVTPTGSFEPVRAGYPVPPARNGSESGAPKNGGGSYIDRDLRARVDLDIAAFLAAFDAALAQDTQESRAMLREATDRLLRAGARTRIELERLEARMPLPRREAASQGDPVWRQR